MITPNVAPDNGSLCGRDIEVHLTGAQQDATAGIAMRGSAANPADNTDHWYGAQCAGIEVITQARSRVTGSGDIVVGLPGHICAREVATEP